MTVLILENAETGFRGEVTQWLLEVKAGVYVGNISAAVRDRLWKKVQANLFDGAAMMIYSAPTEQGFEIAMHNLPERKVVDFDGIYLIARKIKKEEKK